MKHIHLFPDGEHGNVHEPEAERNEHPLQDIPGREHEPGALLRQEPFSGDHLERERLQIA